MLSIEKAFSKHLLNEKKIFVIATVKVECFLYEMLLVIQYAGILKSPGCTLELHEEFLKYSYAHARC